MTMRFDLQSERQLLAVAIEWSVRSVTLAPRHSAIHISLGASSDRLRRFKMSPEREREKKEKQ